MNVESRLPARVLAIEDDPILAAHLGEHLGRCGFSVALRHDGDEGLALACREDFDLILMDIMLPTRSGLDVLAELRRARRVPVILMSALGAEQDRIAGFSQGADDYLPKPFSMGEMVVRIEAILRRVAYERSPPQPCIGDSLLHFDDARTDVQHGQQWAALTTTEYRLLELLWQHKEEVLSKPFLYQHVLRRGYSQHDRSLDMHVSNIRRKLAAIGYVACRLTSVWAKGYLLTCLDA